MTTYDLIVVGGGPAGLAASATGVLGGLQVALVDAGSGLGGQFWRQPPPGSPVGRGEDLHHGLGTYDELLSVVAGGATIRSSCEVWTATRDAVSGDISLHLLDRTPGPGREASATITAPRVVLATGAYDLPLPFPGWDLPGVYTAGGLQALLKGSGVVAGRRVVVGGTGPFLLPVAAGLAARGAAVVLSEANDPRRWLPGAPAALGLPGKLLEGAGYAAALARHRVPVHLRTAVTAAHGTDRVEAVTLSVLDREGSVVPGRDRVIPADAVGVGWGFVPQLDLAVTLGAALSGPWDGNQVVQVDAWQRTSVGGVYAAGEVCGVGGSELALREGQVAAEGVLRDSGLGGVTDAAGLRRVRDLIKRHRRFAAAMAHAHPVPPRWQSWLTDATTVCRCEEIDAGQVRAAVAGGATGPRQVKQLTRAGMGWCQGRMCGPAVRRLCAERAATTLPEVEERLVATPLPLGALARAIDPIPGLDIPGPHALPDGTDPIPDRTE
ncbi:FAD-dependent oxidoreductase [Ornithinimicrobium panacihumi]|uniref:FAD-dependent oxidoreductase n=1 Tax=Ornithinimicrobium panacihumi TaxID=2008449 RepID=UPI003F887AD6